MTDETSERDGGPPPGVAGAPESAADTPPAFSRAFGKRPAITGGVTVLSHNFRAPLVPESDGGPTAPGPAAAEPSDPEGSGRALTSTARAADGNADGQAEAPAIERAAPTAEVPPEISAGRVQAVVEEPEDRPADGDAEPAYGMAGPADEAVFADDLRFGSGAEATESERGPGLPQTELPDRTDEAADTADGFAGDDLPGDGADESESAAGPEPGLPEPEKPDDAKDMAGSLLAVPVRGDLEAAAEGGAADEGTGAELTGKREIRFDGPDEPPAPSDDPRTEPGEVAPPVVEVIAMPPDDVELARKLGISFRDGEAIPGDPARGPTRDEAELMRRLGIRFREDSDPTGSVGDEIAEEARRLGISFRDADDAPSKIKKASLTGRVVMLVTIFSALAGLLFLLLYGETIFGAFFG